jgi:hypothetical protein
VPTREANIVVGIRMCGHSTCFTTAWLTYAQNLNIHSGSQRMLRLRDPEESPHNSHTAGYQFTNTPSTKTAAIKKEAFIWFSQFHY